MAEQTPAEAPAPPRKSPLKLIVAVGAMLAVEAAVIIGAMKMLGGPTPVQAATTAEPVIDDEAERIEEIMVFDGRLFNNRSGVSFLYDTEIFIQVRHKNAGTVQAELEQFSNEIRAELGAIWRNSEPHHFQEPNLENLNRKVTALLNDRYGKSEGADEPVVLKTVIVMSTGFRLDN